MALAFISYRRDDTSQVAQALYLQLKEQFGSGQLFMDVNSIRSGEAWPARIRRRLEAATVVLVLIGAGWLATDKKGRRRLFDRTDWVRNEVLYALRHRIKVVPIAINHTKNLPSRADLPRELRALRNKQATVLRLAAEWGRDVRELSDILAENGFTRNELEDQPTPSRYIRRHFRPLTERQLAAAIEEEIPEWEQWGESPALEFPRIRQELRRTFDFVSFAAAMKFMSKVAPLFDKRKPPHHPRWGNDWKKVRIRLTTWDVRNKITRLDVDTARMIDSEYETFEGRA
ncbi:MAG TPA: 4a-hydroxytetrahydrobiopterin dehydratase [Thermoanaerobaculia bacterium]|jgi:pterin-4a-carbinolamine dehydratase